MSVVLQESDLQESALNYPGDICGRAHLEQPLHTDRWPYLQAANMGVVPVLSALVMSAPTSNSHLHTDRWPSSRRCTWEWCRCWSPW